MRFEYWKTADGTWAWELKSTLGDTVARGTPLPSREGCLSAIKLVKLAAVAPAREVAPVNRCDDELGVVRFQADTLVR